MLLLRKEEALYYQQITTKGRKFQMSHYKLISNYKHIDAYKNSFIELAKNVFGIDFEEWDQNGAWNNDYICYSFLDNNKIIANASINKMKIVLDGKEYQAIQIGTVMTHPDYRKQGLAAKLIKHILDEYEESFDFIYLFANDTVLDFYPKFGFKRIKENCYFLNLAENQYSNDRKSTIRALKLDEQEDRELLKKLAKERLPISTTCGVVDNEHLLMFYFIVFKEQTFYLEEEDLIVMYEVEGEDLHLYDVISQNRINLDDILSNILTSQIKKVHFHFTPDSIATSFDIQPSLSNDALFVNQSWKDIKRDFVFPLTSHA